MTKLLLPDQVTAASAAANGALLATGSEGNLHIISPADSKSAPPTVGSVANVGNLSTDLPLVSLSTGSRGPILGFRDARTAAFITLKKGTEKIADVEFESDVLDAVSATESPANFLSSRLWR